MFKRTEEGSGSQRTQVPDHQTNRIRLAKDGQGEAAAGRDRTGRSERRTNIGQYQRLNTVRLSQLMSTSCLTHSLLREIEHFDYEHEHCVTEHRELVPGSLRKLRPRTWFGLIFGDTHDLDGGFDGFPKATFETPITISEFFGKLSSCSRSGGTTEVETQYARLKSPPRKRARVEDTSATDIEVIPDVDADILERNRARSAAIWADPDPRRVRFNDVVDVAPAPEVHEDESIRTQECPEST